MPESGTGSTVWGSMSLCLTLLVAKLAKMFADVVQFCDCCLKAQQACGPWGQVVLPYHVLPFPQ